MMCKHDWKLSGHMSRETEEGHDRSCPVYKCILCGIKKLYSQYGMWEYWYKDKGWVELFDREKGDYRKEPESTW